MVVVAILQALPCLHGGYLAVRRICFRPESLHFVLQLFSRRLRLEGRRVLRLHAACHRARGSTHAMSACNTLHSTIVGVLLKLITFVSSWVQVLIKNAK